MQIDLEYEIKREIDTRLEDAVQYNSKVFDITKGEHGDIKRIITEANDIDQIKMILLALVEGLHPEILWGIIWDTKI